MNDKQKRIAVHLYQLGAYKPQDKRSYMVEPMLHEIFGVRYPYRKKELDIRFLDVFRPQNDK